MHGDIVNTEQSEHRIGLDDSDNTDKLAGVADVKPISRISASEIWQPHFHHLYTTSLTNDILVVVVVA